MFDFRKISFEDKEWITKCLAVSDFRGAEYCFANNMAWQRLNDTVVTHQGDFYISCSFEDGQPYFTFPAGVKIDAEGKEKYIRLFDELKEYVSAQGKPLIVSSVTDDNLSWIKEYYGDKIICEYDRDSSDYIYIASDLIELKGKKYHGKRNHIKRFMDEPWEYRELTDKEIDSCIEFSAEFYNKNDNADDPSAVVEQYAIDLFLTNMDRLGLKGAVLYRNDKMTGFTVGEQINSDTFVVHIEKALADVQGAYPMLCSQFASHNAKGLSFINREEDLGIEGLRKSKLSYNPAFLLNKNVITFR